MFRSVASNVSALSSGVANSNQTMQHVSSSPSKIPYGGFSPARLQTGSPRRPSHGPANPCLYAVQVRPSDPLAIAGMLSGSSDTTHSRPEALGSPAGYVVPPGQCLLWPHPRLWSAPADLCFRRRVSVALLLTTGSPELPQFTLRVSARVPPSVPRWTMRLPLTVSSSHLLAFANFVVARHPFPHEIRFIVACTEAAKFTLCYGPSGLLALPRPGLLLSSFHLRGSLPGNVEYNYMGIQLIPMAGLSPARHAALWAAHEITLNYIKEHESEH